MPPDADVVVVGAGIAGAATTRALARAGRSVILLEQFELGHKRGSSHGTSRIFRLSYPDERYVSLARRALDGWRELESDCGEQLILRSGSLDLGSVAEANASVLAASGVPHERLTGSEVATRWPIGADPDEPALFQPDGGTTRADRAYAALLESARDAGAQVQEQTRVTSIDNDGADVRVAADTGELRAGAVVVTAGAWANEVLAPLAIELPVTVTRETVSYFGLPGAEELPTVIDDLRAPGVHSYALGAPGLGLKAGLHRFGPVTEPSASGEPDQNLVRETAAWVAQRYPEADPQPLYAETCLYTNTPDESFVLERQGRIVIGSACSGHGFKFAPVVGERLAELAVEAL
jgi:sarcosine oxidase